MMPMKIIKDYDLGSVSLTENEIDEHDVAMCKEYFNASIRCIFAQMKRELNTNCGKMKGAKTHI